MFEKRIIITMAVTSDDTFAYGKQRVESEIPAITKGLLITPTNEMMAMARGRTEVKMGR
jgi:hypothetical protein